MIRVRNQSIRTRLIWATTLISTVAIAITILLSAITAYQDAKTALTQQIDTVGAILAENLVTPLIFNDDKAAARIIRSARSQGGILSVIVFDPDWGIFAEYGQGSCPVDGRVGDSFEDTHVTSTYTVQDGAVVVGSLQICTSLRDLNDAVYGILELSLVLILTAVVVAWFLARLLARRVSQPIEHLASVMDAVTIDRDFGRRAEKSTDDEIGTLIDGFNEMIENIEVYSQELAEARDMAEAANESKTRFLATMSHELRTPLNAIMGFSEVIKDQLYGDKPDIYQAYARDIHKSAVFQLDLVNDLLDMSRLEAGAYDIHEGTVTPAKLVEESVELFQQSALKKNLEFHVKVAPEPLALKVDPRAIKQVIANLLGNAIKFTPRLGEVVLNAGSTDDGDYRITISDTGIGIKEQDLDRVVSPFERGHSHLTGQYPGTGLGLSICKSIIEKHGGRLSIDSLYGEGTTVSVTIPAHRVAEERTAATVHRLKV
ncbi:MAG: ATP-binding protein [Alphaproteobacteria bacterium]|nr:ATP-binding protein [Alphaproteobacteria bacterium]